MILRELISVLPRASVVGSLDLEISGLQDDSRKVQPGDLFIAVKGITSDGHDFVDAAIERGAAGVVVERAVRDGLPEGVSLVLVPDSRRVPDLAEARVRAIRLTQEPHYAVMSALLCGR